MAKVRQSAVERVLTAYQALSEDDRQVFAESLALEGDLPPPLCYLWVTQAEAARLLRKHRSSVYRDIVAGRLTTNGRVGRGNQLVRVDSIFEILKATREKAPSKPADKATPSKPAHKTPPTEPRDKKLRSKPADEKSPSNAARKKPEYIHGMLFGDDQPVK
jgi:hypothetical protein